MAVEQGYERQVQVRPVTAQPRPSPSAYGYQFGQAVDQLGSTIHQGQIEAYQRERAQTRDRETTKWMHDFAAYRENMDGISRAARTASAPGGAGHVENMDKAVEAGRDALMQGITEDSVRAAATRQFDDYASRFRTSEADWAEVQRAGKVITDTTTASDFAANRVRRLQDPRDYLEEVDLGHRQIDQLSLDPATKDKLKRELIDQKLAIAFLQGRNDEDPEVSKALIKSGVFDQVLEPQQVEVLLNGAEVEIRSKAVAAKAEAAEAKAQAVEQIQTLEEYNRQGVVIPDDQLATASAVALKLGDASLSVKLDGIRADNAFAKAYGNGNATPQQREARQFELAGKAKRSPNEDRELKWLQDHGGALDSAFDRDPVAAIAGRSGAPAIDWTNPGPSFAGRAEWARAQTKATGRIVPPFSDNELQPLKDMYAQPNGKLPALAALDQLGDWRQQADAARMIAPNDAMFQHMATVEPKFRAWVKRGDEALKANSALLRPHGTGKSNETPQTRLLDSMRSTLNRAFIVASPEDQDAIHDVAQAYLAGTLAEKGQNGDAINSTQIYYAMNVAAGGDYRRGGDGKLVLYGGIGEWAGHPFAVEDGYTHPQIANAFNLDRVRQDKAGTGPVNKDGSSFNLTRAYPVAIGGGRYRWETAPGQIVLNKKGAPFISAVAKR